MPEPTIDKKLLDKAYQWAIHTCNAPNVGYSQTYRYEQTVGGITYYDCSSFIYYALLHGGFSQDLIGPPAFTTHKTSEPVYLEKAGFTRLNAAQEKWLPGDILLGKYGKNQGGMPGYDYQHTEMVYKGTENNGEGYLMGAHGAASFPVLADQVSIDTSLSYATKYPVLYRYGAGGAAGYGLSLVQVAAILGNSYAESKVNPGCYHQNTGQWTDFGGGLWMWTDLGAMDLYQQMHDWVEDNYGNWYDADGQIAFFFRDKVWNGVQETSMWIQNTIPKLQWMNQEFPTFQSFLDATDETDVHKMSNVFFAQWETPGTEYNYDADYHRREMASDLVYNYLLEHGNDVVDPEWYYELGYKFIPDDKAMENCVRFWQTASAGGGGGGTHFTHKHPIWMFIRYH